jgi:hypothetical protein
MGEGASIMRLYPYSHYPPYTIHSLYTHYTPYSHSHTLSQHTKGFGLKMLQKFGFKGRLGKYEQGVTAGLQVRRGSI